jgi:hypothetical protein
MNIKKGKNLSIKIATIALFSALYIAISFQPLGIPLIGIGGEIAPEASLGPVYGIILGPVIGPLSTLIGVLGAIFIPNPFTGKVGTSPFGLLTIPSPVLGSIVAGLLIKKSKKRLITSIVIFIVLLILWFLSPVGLSLYYLVIPHIIALFLAIALNIFMKEDYHKLNYKKFILATSILIFLGVMVDHIWGSTIFAYTAEIFFGLSLKKVLAAFIAITFIFIIERLFMTFVGIILAIALISALKRSGFYEKIIE